MVLALAAILCGAGTLLMVGDPRFPSRSLAERGAAVGVTALAFVAAEALLRARPWVLAACAGLFVTLGALACLEAGRVRAEAIAAGLAAVAGGLVYVGTTAAALRAVSLRRGLVHRRTLTRRP